MCRTAHRRTSSPVATAAIPAIVSHFPAAAGRAGIVSSAIETGSAVAVRWRKSHAPARDIVSTCCGGDGAEMGAFIALFFLAAVLS